MNINWFDVHWGAWSNIRWFPLLIILYGLIAYKTYVTFYYAQRLAGTRKAGRLLNYRPAKIIVKAFFLALGCSSLFVALLRPRWDKKEEIVTQKGRDLFIAIDISKSMLAKDLEPNRLEFAKNKIKALVQSLDSERVGLILFAGSAFVQCPLTTDYLAFFMFLDALDHSTVSAGGTAIDQAITQALHSFKNNNQRKNKLLVLVTDGEDFSHDLSAIKQQAHEQGLHIFTLGIGTEHGAPVPLIDHLGAQTGHQKDKQGSIVISRLNEPLLKELSEQVGGRYIQATTSDQDIKELVSQVQAFEKETLDDKKVDQYQEQYHWFLLITFICFALEWIV